MAIDVDVVAVVVVVVVVGVFCCFASPIDNPQLCQDERSNVPRKLAERPRGVPFMSSWMSSPRALPQDDPEATATAMPRPAFEVRPGSTPPG